MAQETFIALSTVLGIFRLLPQWTWKTGLFLRDSEHVQNREAARPVLRSVDVCVQSTGTYSKQKVPSSSASW